ncbi:hypothetical protein [Candidimonas nitroreducens]|uniref:Uncharacterized protein n=1 Tax=Candidimonas nitroreducens TaxID=683354 RepID=A0A225MTM0_9BURK|nr:hypothetical protein [Candidimonas nitroreducens]OWT61999.1 hypothetical protein CEY11_09320 [Candidimonas nitroreducens]
MLNSHRLITLYPGESITIGDTTIKAAHPPGQFINPAPTAADMAQQIDEAMKRARIDHAPAPQMPQEVPGTPINPRTGWPNNLPVTCSISGSTISIPGDGRCAGQEFPTFSTPYAHE